MTPTTITGPQPPVPAIPIAGELGRRLARSVRHFYGCQPILPQPHRGLALQIGPAGLSATVNCWRAAVRLIDPRVKRAQAQAVVVPAQTFAQFAWPSPHRRFEVAADNQCGWLSGNGPAGEKRVPFPGMEPEDTYHLVPEGEAGEYEAPPAVVDALLRADRMLALSRSHATGAFHIGRDAVYAGSNLLLCWIPLSQEVPAAVVDGLLGHGEPFFDAAMPVGLLHARRPARIGFARAQLNGVNTGLFSRLVITQGWTTLTSRLVRDRSIRGVRHLFSQAAGRTEAFTDEQAAQLLRALSHSNTALAPGRTLILAGSPGELQVRVNGALIVRFPGPAAIEVPQLAPAPGMYAALRAGLRRFHAVEFRGLTYLVFEQGRPLAAALPLRRL